MKKPWGDGVSPHTVLTTIGAQDYEPLLYHRLHTGHPENSRSTHIETLPIRETGRKKLPALQQETYRAGIP